jgi:hypothetical protein
MFLKFLYLVHRHLPLLVLHDSFVNQLILKTGVSLFDQLCQCSYAIPERAMRADAIVLDQLRKFVFAEVGRSDGREVADGDGIVGQPRVRVYRLRSDDISLVDCQN